MEKQGKLEGRKGGEEVSKKRNAHFLKPPPPPLPQSRGTNTLGIMCPPIILHKSHVS